MEDIVIFHTNDLHSHLENWPKIRRYLNQEKARLEKAGKTVVTLDLGDFLDQVHPLTEATAGKANIQLMNQVSYDAVTIGNNEGVGLPKEALDVLYDHANFPVVLDNLVDPTTGKPPVWCVPYQMITTKNGTRLALIAATAPFVLTYKPNGWDVQPVAEVLPKILDEVRGISDVIILMSHLGVNVDYEIAEKYPEISIILGSHTHHLFIEGKWVGDTLLAAAGKYGYYIGKVSFTSEAGKISNRQAIAIRTADLEELPEDEAEITSYLNEGQALLEKKIVGKIPTTFSKDLHAETPLIKETLKAIKEFAGVNAAFLNSGLFLGDLPQGEVNQYQLHEILPHPMHLIRVTLSGTDLLRLLGEIHKNQGFISHFNIIGCGFRGKIMGQILFDGIWKDASGKWCFCGEEISTHRKYTLVTVDHLMFVPFFPTIELAGEIEFLFPEFLREVLGKYFTKHYPINQKQGIIL